MSWYIYILKCGNGDLYTGMTDNVARRLNEHRTGQGGRFTKLNRPVELMYQESFGTKDQARQREIQLKTWSRSKRLALVAGDREALKRS